MKNPKKYIWQIEEVDVTGPDYYAAGWYYEDECQQLEGPFKTQEEAEQMLARHAQSL